MDLILHFTLLLMFVTIILLQDVEADIGKYDPYWRKKEDEAKWNAARAYVAGPQSVSNKVNEQVRRSLKGNKSSRKHLHKYNGPCIATNPIDQCWRCDKNWYKNRQKLAECAIGFGHNVTGGKTGRIYEVTDNLDPDLVNPKPGTLRHAVIQDGPLWIIFKRSMVIRLSEELMVTSNKTIDGRGFHVHIANGAGITLQYVNNVIIHGLHIHNIHAGKGGMIRDSISHYGLRTASDGDGISLFGATNIWIDHVSMSRCNDGLIDAIEASTAFTISNSHFTDHNEAFLFGGRDGQTQDEVMQGTVAFNHFGNHMVQRMPRCRYGYFHVVNNDYTHWEMYAIGGSSHPTIISHGNRFTAPPNPNAKEVTKREYAPYNVWKDWVWLSEQDVMLNGAFFNESGDKSKFSSSNKDMMKEEDGTQVQRLTQFAGALNCYVGKPC